MQESLGGNSRTTLIINCSPATYNEAETLSTLRFGMRAKSITNKARINVELSPAELKSKLNKTTAELASLREYVASLEEEVKVWRAGGKVEQAQWAAPGAAPAVRNRLPGSTGISPAPTPSDSRPDTPGYSGLDKDEREEFLRRENEFNDQLAEKEQEIAAKDKELARVVEEATFLRSQEQSRDAMAHELKELRIQSAQLETNAKDAAINLDSYKEKVAELQRDIDDHKGQIEQLRKVQAREKEEEKEKRKQEMLNEMMSKIDMGGTQIDVANDKLRQVLSQLEPKSGESLRETMAAAQDEFRQLQERLRSQQEEAELQTKRATEVQKLLSQRDAAYEDLLAKSGGGAVSVDELKVRSLHMFVLLTRLSRSSR